MIARATLLCIFAVTAAQADPPGRCEPFDALFTIAAGEYAPIALPYLECLNGVDQRYGFNDGPYAVSQCVEIRRRTVEGLHGDQLRNIEFLLTELEREFVWLTWCGTDVGSELPSTIAIKDDWPQRGGRRGRDDR